MQNLYVLGHPVAHSKSPAMHNAAYRALGLDWEYGLADRAVVADACALIDGRDWLALNVTMPYKPLAYRMSAVRTDAAELAEGANVLVNRKGELLADNTDGKGCIAYLVRCGIRFEGARVVVCGTGPTSFALFHAAACAGAEQVTLLGRDEGRAQRKLADYRDRLATLEKTLPCNMLAGSYASAAQMIEEAAIILDATPLGMHEGDPAPFDTELLSVGQTVFDVVYGHGESALLAAARRAGCTALDGRGMLVAQAVETVRDIVAWLDVPVNLEAVDLFTIMHDASQTGDRGLSGQTGQL